MYTAYEPDGSKKALKVISKSQLKTEKNRTKVCRVTLPISSPGHTLAFFNTPFLIDHLSFSPRLNYIKQWTIQILSLSKAVGKTIKTSTCNSSSASTVSVPSHSLSSTSPLFYRREIVSINISLS